MEVVKELKKKAQRLAVLYVEDDSQIREEVTEFLKNFFHRVEIAVNGEEGLEKFRSGDFALVVTDIKMPKLNGLEMAKKIKKIDKETKIIVTSAYDEKNLLINAIENSVDHYIIKPIDFSDFVVYLYKTVSLINLEKKVETFHRHMQAVLNYQDNMIMTIKNGRVTSINKKFLDFFQLESLKEIYDKKINLVDYVVKEVGFFYPQNPGDWARELQEIEDYNLMLKLIDKRENLPKIFSLKIGKLEEFDETIVSLTNISDYINGTSGSKKGEGEFLFFDQEQITHFFTFLKNEINRTKRHGLSLSLIQLVLNSGELSRQQLHEMDRMVEGALDLTDGCAKPTDTKYVIVKIDTKLEHAYSLAKNLYDRLEKKFAGVAGFYSYFGVVSMGTKDTMQDLLSRAEKLVSEAKEHPGKRVQCDNCRAKTPEMIHEQKQKIFDKLLSHAKKKSAVSVINFYNGMKIVEEAQVVSVDSGEETAQLKLSKRQYMTLRSKDKVFITIGNYSADVEAEIDELQYHDMSVRVTGLAFIENSPLNREYVRVTAEPGLRITLQEGRHTVRGEVIDISLKSLACEVPHIEGLTLGKVIDIELVLPVEKKETIDVSAEIYKIAKYRNNYRVVLLLLAERQFKQMISTYITKREKRIVNEIKAQ